MLLFRLFIKTKPPNQTKISVFTWLEKLPKWAKDHQNKTLDPNEEKNFSTNSAVLKFQKGLLVLISHFMKQNRTTSLVSLFVLLEFILNMLVVATFAILFWGLTIKAFDPSLIDLSNSIKASLTYFLPGIESPKLLIDIPFWIQVGNSTTSWILFVLYISVAGNIIPDKQRAYTEQLASTRLVYRKTIIHLNKDREKIRKLLETHNPKTDKSEQKTLQESAKA